MDCAEEVAILKRELSPIVRDANLLGFDILNGKLIVRVSPDAVPSQTIVKAVNSTGMRAELWRDVQPDAAEMGFWQRRSRTVLTVASGVLTFSGFGLHVWLAGGIAAALGSEGMGITSHRVPSVVAAVYALGIVCGAWYVLPKAWHALRRFRPDMNFLMTLAVVGAVAIGEWFEAATVSFLFALSLALESWSVGRARRAVEALMSIAPDTVRLLKNGREVETRPTDVLVGDRFLVKPGDRIGLDGTVVSGMSEVNQAPITGESVPVPKEAGSQVFAGTVNGNGSLQVEVTRLAGQTTLAQIIRMVGEAQSRRAPSEQWVDRFAQVYTPVVLFIATLVAVLPPVLLAGSWSDWLYRSLVLLVIGCPCALVISTPVSIVASLAAAARNGVLVKGGVHMETPARLKAVALDKTGTLTHGTPAVVSVVPMNGHTEVELLERIGAMEAHSDHPLARAITTYVNEKGIQSRPATDFQTIPGKGATARFNAKAYWLGSHRYLEERGQETDAVHRQLTEMARSGQTVVVVGNEEHVCGFVTLADTVRHESATAVRQLHELGIAHIVMLTGDNQPTAEAIARETGVDEIRAELLPAEKVSAVEDLVRRYGSVAMIGDGINDAPAMGRATLGIAMGAAGSATAIEAGDIALMSDDLSRLPWLIRHSRRTLAIIRQNIVLSLGVKAVFVVLTFLGHASLWAAIAADMGVSLVVITNALRLLRSREPDVP